MHRRATLCVDSLSYFGLSWVRDKLVLKIKWSVVKVFCSVPGGSQVLISYGTNSGTAVSGFRNLISFTDEVRTCCEKLG